MSEAGRPKRGLLFWLGIGLIVVSFALYPAYGMIVMLPVSRGARAASMAAGWGISWSLFVVGSLLAGKEGVELLREHVAKRRALLTARFSFPIFPGQQPVPPEPRSGGEGEPPRPETH
ncbi:MAG: hypothetical protein ACREQQ_00145 [Candidatus Binatia bacterium]